MGKIGSAGITDLRYGYLRDEDWAGNDRFARRADDRAPLPLPAGVSCYAAAAALGETPAACKGRLWGDSLVPVGSALGRHRRAAYDLGIPEERTWVGYGMNHLDLLSRPDVYAQVRQWLAA